MVSSFSSAFSSSKLVTESAMEIQQKVLSSFTNNNNCSSKARTQYPSSLLPYQHLRPSRGRQHPHRYSHEIIKEILQTVYSRTRKGHYCRPVEIAYRCEITWPQLKQFRTLLLHNKLLISSDTKSFSHYKITDKGLRYLQLFNEIEDFLEPVNNVLSSCTVND
jgi:predicted transcriptional regulator